MYLSLFYIFIASVLALLFVAAVFSAGQKLLSRLFGTSSRKTTDELMNE